MQTTDTRLPMSKTNLHKNTFTNNTRYRHILRYIYIYIYIYIQRYTNMHTKNIFVLDISILLQVQTVNFLELEKDLSEKWSRLGSTLIKVSYQKFPVTSLTIINEIPGILSSRNCDFKTKKCPMHKSSTSHSRTLFYQNTQGIEDLQAS